MTLQPELAHLPGQVVGQAAQCLAIFATGAHLASGGVRQICDALDVAVDLFGYRTLLFGRRRHLGVQVADTLDLSSERGAPLTRALTGFDTGPGRWLAGTP